MKKNICLKSTLRQPVRTLFFLLLAGLVSFAFISRAVEYLVVQGETARLTEYYRTVASLEKVVKTHEDDYDVTAGVELVSKSPYVAFEDRRRYSSGVLQGVYNSDVDGYLSERAGSSVRNSGLHISDVLVYGTLQSKTYTPPTKPGTEEYLLTLQVDKVLAGYPEYAGEGRTIKLKYCPESSGELDEAFNGLQVGERYFIKAYFDPFYDNVINQTTSGNLVLKPLNNNGLWFFPLEPDASADFSDPALMGLDDEIKVLVENQRAMQVIGTGDMSAIPAMQEVSRQNYLVEGRWLNREDDTGSRRVCVVHQDFAELRGLSVGDKITISLRELKAPYYGSYIVPGEDWGVWGNYDTDVQEFEIVGLYGILSENPVQLSVYSTRMYIPNSCMPEGYRDPNLYSDSLYSFILRSPQDKDDFLAENGDALEALGMRVSFVDNGWDNFQASAVPIKQSVAMNAGVFALVTLMALILTVVLYLRQRRREFAILRALGVPKQDAIMQTLWPITLIGAAGILTGGLLSWHYALGKASETLASLQGQEDGTLSGTLSPVWLAGLCAGLFVIIMIFTAIGALATARRPVLELIQGTAVRVTEREPQRGDGRENPKGRALRPQSAMPTLTAIEVSSPFPRGTPESVKNSGFAQIARYIMRHSRRGPLKSVLTILVALCFTLALGWMSWSMEGNEAELDRLYGTTQVEGEIVKKNASAFVSDSGSGIIRKRTVEAIMETGFIQSAYLEAGAISRSIAAADEEGKYDEGRTAEKVALRAFERPDKFFSQGGRYITLEYADGWNENLFAMDWSEDTVSRPVVVPAGLLDRLELKPGDGIWLSDSTGNTAGNFVIAGQYTGTVIGDEPEPILIPTTGLKLLVGENLNYSVAEFVLDPSKNRNLPEFRKKMETLFADGGGGIIGLNFLLWDEVLTQVVEPLEKNLSLMAVLYPVTVVLSVIIAAGLALLLMFQTAREAAIMRVLGTAKHRARVMLWGEQLLLCFIGLLSGLILLIALRQDVSEVLAGTALTCAGLYLAGTLLGALSGAIFVTNRMPLELLQVKE